MYSFFFSIFLYEELNIYLNKLEKRINSFLIIKDSIHYTSDLNLKDKSKKIQKNKFEFYICKLNYKRPKTHNKCKKGLI